MTLAERLRELSNCLDEAADTIEKAASRADLLRRLNQDAEARLEKAEAHHKVCLGARYCGAANDADARSAQ